MRRNAWMRTGTSSNSKTAPDGATVPSLSARLFPCVRVTALRCRFPITAQSIASRWAPDLSITRVRPYPRREEHRYGGACAGGRGTGPGKTELREFPMPDIHEDAALLQVEVAGICGTDVKMYARPPFADPVIMGHENTGVIAKAGPKFVERHGVDEGERVFVEHYVPCCRCEWCRAGEYRHCRATDWRTNPDARRYGYTSAENPFHLWGGFARYMYLANPPHRW